MRKTRHLQKTKRESFWNTLLLLISLSVCSVGSEQSRVIYIHRSEQYTLNCHIPAENIIEHAGLQINRTGTVWYRDGVEIQYNQQEYTLHGSDLMIEDFTEITVGDYYCTTLLSPFYTQPHLIISTKYQLKLAVPSEVVFPSSHITLYERRSVLTCPIHGVVPSLPSYNITWYENGVEIDISDTGRYLRLPAGKLYMLNLTREDNSTTWSCSVKTLNKIISSTNNVTINVLPYNSGNINLMEALIDTPPTHIQVDDTTTEVIVPCFTRGADKIISWGIAESDGIYRDISQYDLLKNTSHVHYLNLSSIIHQNSANIITKCAVKSGTKRIFYNTTITKNFAPRISTNPTYNPLYLSLKTTLVCRVPSRALARLTWYKDGQPVLLCHKRMVTHEGSLTLEYVSVNDSGVYQCKYENDFGQAINTHIVKASVSPSVREMDLELVITDTKILSESLITIEWRMCTRNVSEVFMFNFNRWPIRCQHDVRTMSQVKTFDDTDCISSNRADSSLSCSNQHQNDCLCCHADIKVLTQEAGWITEIMAYTKNGAQLSNIFSTSDAEYLAYRPPQTTNLPQTHDMNIRLYDFGSALVITWDRVESASRYHLSIDGVFQEGDILPEDLSHQQSADLNFTIITDEHLSRLSARSQLIITPITARQSESLSIRLTRERNITGNQPFIVTQVSNNNHDLLVFWNWNPGDGDSNENTEPHKYLLWYNCDGNEGLIWFNATTNRAVPNRATIPNNRQPVTCEIYLGVFNSDGETLRGVFTRYDRWCRSIIPPHNITISPDFNTDSSSEWTPIKVRWLPDYNKLICEVDYIIKWKRKGSLYFYEDDRVIVRNVNFAIIPNLKSDIRYEIQIIAYTNETVQQNLSAISYYTAGAPFSVRNLSINQSHINSGLVLVNWSDPRGEHSISYFFITLYIRTNSSWSRVTRPTATIAERSTSFKSLIPRTWYNVTVRALNEHGAGAVNSLIFRTPACTTYPDCQINPTSSTGLTETQLGVIIGLVAAAIFAFIAALICIIFRRRWKPIRRHTYHATPLVNLERRPMRSRYNMESVSGYSGETTRRMINSDSMLTVTSTSAREDNSEEIPLRTVKSHNTEGVDSGIADWDKPTDSLSLTFSNDDDEFSIPADTPTYSSTYPFTNFLPSEENKELSRFHTEYDPD